MSDAYEKAVDAVLEGDDGRLPIIDARLRERFVIIDRADLPEVVRLNQHTFEVGDARHVYTVADLTVERVEEVAAAWLAMARNLREHPPVDEAQVEAIRKALLGFGMNEHDARVLYGRGVRVEVSKS